MKKLIIEKLIMSLFSIKIHKSSHFTDWLYIEEGEIYVHNDYRASFHWEEYTMALLHEVGHTRTLSKYNRHQSEFEADLFAVRTFAKITSKEESLAVFKRLTAHLSDIDSETHPSRAKRLANVSQLRRD